MITAAEYRAWAEESLEWAQIATNESSRQAYIRWAEIWLESAFRVERLATLQERLSTEPIPTTEHVWDLFKTGGRASERPKKIGADKCSHPRNANRHTQYLDRCGTPCWVQSWCSVQWRLALLLPTKSHTGCGWSSTRACIDPAALVCRICPVIIGGGTRCRDMTVAMLLQRRGPP